MPYAFNPFTGNFDYFEAAGAGGAQATPTKIPVDSVFTVAADTQVLFTEEIELDGELDLDGVLVEVN